MNISNYIKSFYTNIEKCEIYLQETIKTILENIHSYIYENTDTNTNINTKFIFKNNKDALEFIYKTYIIHYIRIWFFIDNIYRKLTFIGFNIFNKFAKYIPEHVLCINYFNIKTMNIITLVPILYLFKYYRIPHKLHEEYYTITVWSTKELKYKSIFIDALILSELEKKYSINPYTINNVLNLLKYKNNIISLHINSVENTNSYYVNKYKSNYVLKPYFESLAIPNNVTLRALYILYLYKNNYPLNHIINFDKYFNVTAILKHSNGYEIQYTDINSIVYSSLDVTVVD
jgi:hypothetical protein